MNGISYQVKVNEWILFVSTFSTSIRSRHVLVLFKLCKLFDSNAQTHVNTDDNNNNEKKNL